MPTGHRGPNRPPPSPGARKRRQNAIALALSQADPKEVFPSSGSTHSRPSTPPLSTRDGLSNSTNLVLTPKRSSPKRLRAAAENKIYGEQVAIDASDPAHDAKRPDLEASQVSSHHGSQLLTSSQPEMSEYDPFVASTSAPIPAPSLHRPSTPPTRDVSNHHHPTEPAVSSPPPSQITRNQPGVFFTASNRRLQVSAAALDHAKEFAARMDLESAAEDGVDDDIAMIDAVKSSFIPSSQGVKRPVLPFKAPLRAGMNRQIHTASQVSSSNAPPSVAAFRPPTAPFAPSSQISRASGPPASFQTPSRPPSSFASASSQISRPPSTPKASSTAFAKVSSVATPGPIASRSGTPQRTLGMNHRTSGTPSGAGRVVKQNKFSTPFKGGVRPGSGVGSSSGLPPPSPRTPMTKSATRPMPKDPHSTSTLGTVMRPSETAQGENNSSDIDKGKEKALALGVDKGLTRSSTRLKEGRLTLRQYGVTPGVFNAHDLVAQAIPLELLSLNANAAEDYGFYLTSPSGDVQTLGWPAALDYLHTRGCRLATPEWTRNHWGLVLWKRAGIVCCKPNSFRELWNFEGMCEALNYHYDRDLNKTQRPILRLILERDAPAARPMVLCVSAMWWTAQTISEDGSVIVLPHPTFELTDGWYRVKAEVDEALARAARRRKIRIGTKLIVVGSKLQADGDAKEALKAYETSTLTITGNSTTLARWDARLGPLLYDLPHQPSRRGVLPHVASLRSLTADGGLIMLIDIVVEKLHPVGHIETLPDGTRKPPTNESENAGEDAKWEVSLFIQPRLGRRRMVAIEAERERLDRSLAVLLNIAERASTLARGWVPGPDDDEPDSIDSVFEELDDAENKTQCFKAMNLTPQEHAWLAKYITKRVEERRGDMGGLLESEVNDVCPPRVVSNFRIISVRDARPATRNPVERTAQLTMWDVLSLGPEFLVEGRRYLVSNVVPSHPSSWAAAKEDGEVILKSTRSTRWHAIR
ncbi:hypothetical protein DL93DRAFT_2104290 [Clavulina sp. PMI_390]|nr:hypothetical protein DL93DRAFT_2104290 [Clavulina sp. PMI_390]